MPKEYNFGTKTTFTPNKHYKFGKKIEPKVLVTLRGLSMGGQYMVRAVTNADTDFEILNSNIKQTLDIVENQMSVFKLDSILMQFNAHPINKWFSLPQETADVIDIAFKINEKSNGALDITLEPVIELWGFGAVKTNKAMPHIDELTALRCTVGHQHLKFDLAGKRILKTSKCRISLNSVAKGYGVDLVAEFLKSQSIEDFLVEVDGEIVTSGNKPDGSNWRLGIEKPIVKKSESHQILSLTNVAVATSGDYKKYFEHQGQRISHVIDPKTHRPITHNLASVTIVDESSAMADALATAMLVMGEKLAIEYAQNNKIAAYLIIKDEEDFRVTSTEKMQQYLA